MSEHRAKQLLPSVISPVFFGLAALFCARLAWQWRNAELPYENLRSFAVSESAGKQVQDIQDLPVDELSLYAQATCVRADRAEIIRRALRAQLRRVPQEALDDIISGAVVDEVSSTNSIQNTTAGIEKNGVAYHYIAFWSTVYNGESPIATTRYVTCVTTAGIKVTVGEDIAEWKTTRMQRYLGSKPCHCGYLYCEKCPIFTTDETKTPIFKRHKLTLRQQVQLHSWMVLQAVERAKSLTSARKSILGSFLLTPRDNQIPAAAFHALDSESFLGNDTNFVPGQVDHASSQLKQDL